MTVKATSLVTQTKKQNFTGLSTDTKPTTNTKGGLLGAGSSFIELDTKAVFLFDGISAWYPN